MSVHKTNIVLLLFGLAGLLLLTFGLVFVFPWKQIDWGEMGWVQERVVTVTGTAEKQEKTQVARFSAGVSVVKDNKDEAMAEVNSKVEAIIEAVKAFGIDEADIKTQQISVYQQEETYYEEGRQKRRPGQWRVSNTVEIVLRDVERTSALADLLTQSGATNVHGPNFSVEEVEAENELLVEAIEDAREKATVVAEASGGELGQILRVVEGYQTVGVAQRTVFDGMGGGGPPVEPGSTTVGKTVTVTFLLK